jgi:DNA-binding XRE family transcriptional regulator
MPPGLQLDPQRLKILRLERALSQTALGRLAGIRSATVCDAETGKRQPNLVTIKALAEALGVQPTDIASINGH